jgi:uncharacterized membrane protein
VGKVVNLSIDGLWDESAQTIVFEMYAPVTSQSLGTYRGYLLRTPLNAAEGQDIVASLVG